MSDSRTQATEQVADRVGAGALAQEIGRTHFQREGFSGEASWCVHNGDRLIELEVTVGEKTRQGGVSVPVASDAATLVAAVKQEIESLLA
jgi:hypothetical protein